MKANLVFALILLLFAGCSSSSSKGGSHSQNIPNISDQDLLIEQNRWDDGAIPKALEGGLFQDIYFEFDSAVVSPEYREQIRKNAQVLAADSSLRVEVEGHCDNRGTREYNFALGEERARTVASLLVSFGVSATQVSIISYGAEIPLSLDEGEDSWQKNRRVHFALYRKKSNT